MVHHPLIESCCRSRTPVPRPRIPFSFWPGRASSGINSYGQQFSCGVIDIVESMSRRVILTAVCAPPSVSFFLNFYDVTLPDFRLILCVDVYVLYDYSYIYPRLLLLVALPLTRFRHLVKMFIAEIPLLNSSRMPGHGGRGRGRGANDPPPPPDYMAAMMQQFQLNQVFMQAVINQLQNQNQNHHNNHQHGVDL